MMFLQVIKSGTIITNYVGKWLSFFSGFLQKLNSCYAKWMGVHFCVVFVYFSVECRLHFSHYVYTKYVCTYI